MSTRIVVRDLVSDLAPNSRASRTLYAGAAFWLSLGILFLIPLGLDRWNFEGAVSWRKPVTFSISVGLLLGTIGWVLDRLRGGRFLSGAIAWTFLISSTVEVGLISLQTARGRASHFNVFEEGDAFIFTMMGIAVGVMSLCIVAVFVWSLVRRPSDPLFAVAIIAGLVLVVSALGLGSWIIRLGVDFAERNNVVPETVMAGSAGVAKYPHAVALHGIQLFIISALLLRRTAQSISWRMGHLIAICLGYFALLGFLVVQTVGGFPVLTLNFALFGILAALATVGLAVWSVIRARLETAKQPQGIARAKGDMLHTW